VPWGLLVGRLLDHDPEQARWVAGTFAQHVERLAREGDAPVHPVVCAVAGYLGAATELVLGRPTRAVRWARESDALVEFEVPPGVGVATYIRAATQLSAGRARWWGEP
jgi:enoyl-CoA hydratase/carnithine racemase